MLRGRAEPERLPRRPADLMRVNLRELTHGSGSVALGISIWSPTRSRRQIVEGRGRVRVVAGFTFATDCATTREWSRRGVRIARQGGSQAF